MFGGHRFEILHYDAILLAAAEQDSAGLRGAMGRGGKGIADFLVDAFHGTAADSDRRQSRRLPSHILELHFLAGG